MKILFIEDNPDVYEPVTGLLERRGHTVKVTPDADTAVREINSQLASYNCIVLDIMMMLGTIIEEGEAEDTGIAIYKRIRNKDTKIRVVVLSALSKGDIWKHFQGDPFVTYQAKPVLASSIDFMQKVEGLLND